MRWLIVEDSLESRKGHWFEYLEGFCRELTRMGDSVNLLVSHRAEPCVLQTLSGEPVLPESAFVKMSDSASPLRRIVRIPLHAGKTFLAMKRYFRKSPSVDLIFVPTVIVHQLLGWFFLLKLGIVPNCARLLLFFPGLPITNKDGFSKLDGSLTSVATLILINLIAPEIRNGRVILGVEASAMKEAAEEVFAVSFTYFPHPVSPAPSSPNFSGLPPIIMACYGLARYEKGSDLLIQVIERHLERNPDSNIQFVFQWIQGFTGTSGEYFQISESLKRNPRVEIIDRLFQEGEYSRRLKSTHAMILPYRESSYGLRVSRVMIEAIVNGIPTISTEGTTLHEQALNYGAGLTSKEDVESILAAIEQFERDYNSLAAKAREQQSCAREHFSIFNFRNTLEARRFPHVILRGWYGEENLGDDLLLLKILEEIDKNIALTIVGRIEGLKKLLNKYKGKYAIKAKGNIFHRIICVINNDIIIIGGGGLFPNKKNSLGSYLDLILAVLLKKKIIIIGISINPSKLYFERKIWGFLAKNAAYISVRDSETKKFLDRSSNLKALVEMNHDLFLSGFLKSNNFKNNKNNNIYLNKPYALVCPFWLSAVGQLDQKEKVRAERLGREFVEAMKVIRVYGYNNVLISFFPRDDRLIIETIKEKYDFTDIIFLEYNENFFADDINELYQNAAFSLCMRFHALVLSIMNTRNFISICYDHKSSSLLKEIGLEDAGLKYGISKSMCYGFEGNLRPGELARRVHISLNRRRQIEYHLAKVAPVIQSESKKSFQGLNDILKI